MIYTATITSQGQITIPAEVRRKLKLDKRKTVILRLEDDGLYINSVPDFMELGGSLHKYAIKDKSIDEIIEMEEKAADEGWGERYENFLKREKRKK
jgi:AbrB family looped-hinge helix DNA binding protein